MPSARRNAVPHESTAPRRRRRLAPFLLAVCLADPAVAQPAARPIRESFVVETDGTAEKKLAAAAEHVAGRRWDAAVSLLREVAVARPDAVVRVEPGRSLSLPLYCDVLLSRLPPDGLRAYRSGVDAQAAARLAESAAADDARSLESVADRGFVSSSGDDAVFRLAERAWERGDFDLARRLWTLLVPLGPTAGPPPAVLRYPDTDLDLAAVRARLVLCSVAFGERNRAARELDAFRRLHPDAAGLIAGRNGPLAESLADILATPTDGRSGPGRSGWDPLPPTAATHTFGQTPARSGRLPFEPRASIPLWSRPLPASEYLPENERPALPVPGPLSYYPVVWKDKVFVADPERVFGFELATGRAAWAVGDEDSGAVYPPAADLTLDGITGGRPFAADPLAGVPRQTLSVRGDRLFARLGSPVTIPAARELRRPSSSLVCLDLARQGLLAWALTATALGGEDDWWAFEGPPVADADRLYALATRSRPQAQLNALCLDAATGSVLWNRPVGAPIAAPPEALDVLTHRLVTACAGRLYVQTNQGAVVCLDADDGRPVWVGWYESTPPARPEANTHGRNLPAAPLVSGGVVVTAPADSDRIFAHDAESGVELWSTAVRGGGRELLGAVDGVLVASGERLVGLDLFTGRERWTTGFEDPAGFGAGRGLLAGRYAYWPTREDLFVVEIETGAPARRVPLAGAYGLTGGGNLAAAPGRLLLARPDGLVALGDP